MNDLRIEYLSPDELTPYENNTRKHAPDDIESIKKSILDTGFNDPIGIWGENNLIVEGHGRQIAAKELHLDRVPCIRLDHLTDEQRREYAIRHNRSAELSAWDFETLEEELAKLSIDGIDMGDLKFADKNFTDLMDAMQDDFGISGEKRSDGFGVVSLTFEEHEAQEIRSYIKKNGDNDVLQAVKDVCGV